MELANVQKSVFWVLVAALVGGIVAQAMSKDAYTAKKRALYLFCGAATAYYLAPYVLYKWHLSDPSEIALIYFAIGGLWNSLFEKAVESIRSFQLPFGSK